MEIIENLTKQFRELNKKSLTGKETSDELVAHYGEQDLTEARLEKLMDKIMPSEMRSEYTTGVKKETPKWKMEKFIDDFKSASDYTYIIGKIMKGNLSRSHAMNFKELNPFLYSKVRYKAFNFYEEQKENFNYSQKLALENFLDIDTITNLRGGMFNVNEENAEPVGAIDQHLNRKQEFIKGTLKENDRPEQKSASERLASL